MQKIYLLCSGLFLFVFVHAQKTKDSTVYTSFKDLPLKAERTIRFDTKEGTFVSVPQRLQIPENIKEQLIVELYNK